MPSQIRQRPDFLGNSGNEHLRTRHIPNTLRLSKKCVEAAIQKPAMAMGLSGQWAFWIVGEFLASKQRSSSSSI